MADRRLNAGLSMVGAGSGSSESVGGLGVRKRGHYFRVIKCESPIPWSMQMQRCSPACPTEIGAAGGRPTTRSRISCVVVHPEMSKVGVALKLGFSVKFHRVASGDGCRPTRNRGPSAAILSSTSPARLPASWRSRADNDPDRCASHGDVKSSDSDCAFF